MTTKTNVPASAADKQRVLAAGLFAQAMQRNSTMGRLSGPMPRAKPAPVKSCARPALTADRQDDGPVARQGRRGRVPVPAPVGAYPIWAARPPRARALA